MSVHKTMPATLITVVAMPGCRPRHSQTGLIYNTLVQQSCHQRPILQINVTKANALQSSSSAARSVQLDVTTKRTAKQQQCIQERTARQRLLISAHERGAQEALATHTPNPPKPRHPPAQQPRCSQERTARPRTCGGCPIMTSRKPAPGRTGQTYTQLAAPGLPLPQCL